MKHCWVIAFLSCQWEGFYINYFHSLRKWRHSTAYTWHANLGHCSESSWIVPTTPTGVASFDVKFDLLTCSQLLLKDSSKCYCWSVRDKGDHQHHSWFPRPPLLLMLVKMQNRLITFCDLSWEIEIPPNTWSTGPHSAQVPKEVEKDQAAAR